jgi:hypothetical protein
MRRWLWLALVGLLVAAPWASPSPIRPEKPQLKLALPGHGVLISVVDCKGGERSSALAATITEAPVLLAMYVYDAHGNCIGRDEYEERAPITEKRRPATDDVSVEWYPRTDGPFTIEVRNLSAAGGIVQMAVE